jgi:hypothetical protein
LSAFADYANLGSGPIIPGNFMPFGTNVLQVNITNAGDTVTVAQAGDYMIYYSCFIRPNSNVGDGFQIQLNGAVPPGYTAQQSRIGFQPSFSDLNVELRGQWLLLNVPAGGQIKFQFVVTPTPPPNLNLANSWGSNPTANAASAYVIIMRVD